AQVDYRALNVGTYPWARLDSPLRQLDLGGIAKGYAVDVLADMLCEAGFSCFVIDGGGDLRIGAPPPGKEGWRIQFPDGTYRELSRVALATSGDRYRYLYHRGQRYSHLIDPRTGLGISHGYAVTVEARSCTQADALASALSILGPEQGPPWLSSRPVQFFYPAKAVFYR
ncbi:MAG: FAD:protein FMN transferase, partial [Bacteroidota bacterium]